MVLYQLSNVQLMLQRQQIQMMLKAMTRCCGLQQRTAIVLHAAKHRHCVDCLHLHLPGKRLAAVRVYCATGNWRAAEEVVTTTQDPAAAFHLARLYEAQERVGDAVRCYSIAKRYSHAARLAKRCVHRNSNGQGF